MVNNFEVYFWRLESVANSQTSLSADLKKGSSSVLGNFKFPLSRVLDSLKCSIYLKLKVLGGFVTLFSWLALFIWQFFAFFLLYQHFLRKFSKAVKRSSTISIVSLHSCATMTSSFKFPYNFLYLYMIMDHWIHTFMYRQCQHQMECASNCLFELFNSLSMIIAPVLSFQDRSGTETLSMQSERLVSCRLQYCSFMLSFRG